MNALRHPSKTADKPAQKTAGTVATTMLLFRTETGEIIATISGTYYRGSRDIDDPEEIIDLEARDEAGNRIELTEREEERAISKLMEVAR